MVLRATAYVTVVLMGLAAPAGEALAQFNPPGPPVMVPPPFRSLPPVADDDDLPPYDPPPGYRRLPRPGAGTQPPQTYQREALPPPGPYGHVEPAYPPGREPVYAPPPGGYREAAPPPGYEPDPRGGRPQYGNGTAQHQQRTASSIAAMGAASAGQQ